MTTELPISGRVTAAARALSGVSQANLATAAGITVERLGAIEGAGSAWISSEDADAVRRGLEHYGVIVIPEGDGMGVGVRLKFTRQDVRQIVRLEGEGGIVASDDAP